MFGFFTYPHKVAKGLFDRGWSPETLPPTSNAWLQMIHAMRQNGIGADRAAGWLDLALQGDEDAISSIDANSGVFGMMFFGTKQIRAENPGMFLKK